MEVRLHNRRDTDIKLQAGEILGIIEKIKPKEDKIIQGYELDSPHHLCIMEITENNQSVSNPVPDEEINITQEKYRKIEVGAIEKSTQLRLRKLLHQYEDIFDWDNDTIGHTNLLRHQIIIEENTIPISHRPYRISPLEADHLKRELENIKN